MSQDQVVMKLARGTCRYLQKAREVAAPGSTASFSDVGGDRGAGTPNLARQSIHLLGRKLRRHLLHNKSELVTLLPNLQLFEVLHKIPPAALGLKTDY